MAEEAERVRADPAGKAEDGELGAWRQFKVSPALKIGAHAKDVADTRWVSTWTEAGGEETTKARQVAKGRRDPDLRDGNVDIAGHGGRRFPHLQSISPGARRGCKIWSLDIKSALSLAYRSGREVLLRAPGGWGSENILAAFGNWVLRCTALLMPWLDKYFVLA